MLPALLIKFKAYKTTEKTQEEINNSGRTGAHLTDTVRSNHVIPHPYSTFNFLVGSI